MMNASVARSRKARLVAGLGTLFLVAVISWGTRDWLIDKATATATQHAKVMASHTEQSFKTVHVLLEVLATDLHGRDLHALAEDAGRQMLRARMSGALAQVRNMSIMDAEGRQLFLSTDVIGGTVDVADRDYFRLLKEGAETSSSGPYVGRNSNQATYALAQRIDDDKGEMIGLAQAALRPEFFEEFCRTVYPPAALHTALVSDTGVVIATCEKDNPFVTRKLADLPQFRPAAWLLGAVPGIRVEQRIGAYPLDVVVSLSGWGVIKAGRWEALSACLLAALIGAVAAMVSTTIRRSEVRTAEEMRTLERRVSERTQELEVAKQAAEMAVLAKSRFLAAASHDLRQPFHAMRLLYSVLQSSITDPRQAEALAKLDSAMLAGEELLTSLLDVAKLDAGQETIVNEPVSIPEVLGAVTSDFAVLAADKGLRLKVRSPDVTVMADKTTLRRIVANLTSNALRYTKKGGVLIACRQRHGSPRIEVWDSGIGIPEEHIQTIFEEFYQVGNGERDRNRGLGLGLSIVRRLCGLVDYQLSVRSRVGKGSVFSVTLPPTAKILETTPANLGVPPSAGSTGRSIPAE